jgi:general secretion pathway protein G
MNMYKMSTRSLRAAGRGGFASRGLAAGFTLIEMIAVLVLLALVMGFVGGKVIDNFNKGEYNAGKAKMKTLEQAVQAYLLDNGGPPQSLNDLVTRPGNAANWSGPYAKQSDLKDPFGHPYTYKIPGEHGEYDVIFLGKDGQPGGDGLNKDVGSWE